MRIFWVGLATRYLAWAVRVSRYSGLTSLLSKSKKTTRWASGLFGSSSGLTAGAVLTVAGAAGATVAGAGAWAGALVGFTFLEQPTTANPRMAMVRARRMVFIMMTLLWKGID